MPLYLSLLILIFSSPALAKWNIGKVNLENDITLQYPHSAVFMFPDSFSMHLYIADTDQHRIVYERSTRSGTQTTIIAGTGIAGYSGDNGEPSQATLHGPFSLALASSSRLLYVADRWNHVIRRIQMPYGSRKTATIKTIAGNGIAGYSGDGEAPLEAMLNQPSGIVYSPYTGLYIADSFNHRVRQLNFRDGTITLLAGNGVAGYSGDGGLATAASLNEPTNLALDAWGNVYVAEYLGHRIRRIDEDGIISTIAGTGEAGFSGDDGLAVDAQINHPSGITVDRLGNIYISDTLNHRIRQIDRLGIIRTFAGTGVAGFSEVGGQNNRVPLQAQFDEPKGLSIRPNYLGSVVEVIYVADKNNHRICTLSRSINQDYVAIVNGDLAHEALWLRGVINTVESGDIEGVWNLRGDAYVPRGDRVLWGYFYADPEQVDWGSPDNPEMFVKIWQDVSGRTDVNFFHVSVPNIDVYSSAQFPEGARHSDSTLTQRYARHFYTDSEQDSSSGEELIDTPDALVITPNFPHPNPYASLHAIQIGVMIHTEEKGEISGIWQLGGQATSARGDEVMWGYFYADPADVTWGNVDNPEVFVKIWADVSGRIDVNFFHVSVPNIRVLSGTDGYQLESSLSLQQRYARHEFTLK